MTSRSDLNDLILTYTDDFENVTYGFGSKDPNSGSVDCSGWVEYVLMHAVKKLALDQEFIIKLGQWLGNAAAYQVQKPGNANGFKHEDDMKPGMLVGLEFLPVPGWARGRPHGISHILLVCQDDQGNVAISQSSSTGGGVTLSTWEEVKMKYSRGIPFIVDPFEGILED